MKTDLTADNHRDGCAGWRGSDKDAVEQQIIAEAFRDPALMARIEKMTYHAWFTYCRERFEQAMAAGQIRKASARFF